MIYSDKATEQPLQYPKHTGGNYLMNIEEIRELTGNERLDPDFPDTVKLALYERYFELQEQLDKVKAHILSMKPEEPVPLCYDYRLNTISTEELQSAFKKAKPDTQAEEREQRIHQLMEHTAKEFEANTPTIDQVLNEASKYKSYQPEKVDCVCTALRLRREVWLKYCVRPHVHDWKLNQLDIACRYLLKLNSEIKYLEENHHTATVVLNGLRRVFPGPDLLPSIEWLQTRDDDWWSL